MHLTFNDKLVKIGENPVQPAIIKDLVQEKRKKKKNCKTNT